MQEKMWQLDYLIQREMEVSAARKKLHCRQQEKEVMEAASYLELEVSLVLQSYRYMICNKVVSSYN